MLRFIWNHIKKYWIFVVTFSIIAIISMSFIFVLHQPPNSLPIYAPNMIDRSLVDTSVQYVRKYHTIADFELLNQNGDTITQANYKGKIYVADFFYTTCPSFCPILTNSMERIQKATRNDDGIMLASFTVTPHIDTVAQLKRYAEKNGVITGKWNLLTGSKKEIYNLARKSYCVVKTTGDGGRYDMIHTENLVLIDSKKRIRGFYDGTNPEEVDQLIEDIQLLKEIEAREAQEALSRS